MVKLLNHCVSFLVDDDDDVILKYNKIWNKIKKFFTVEFDSQSAYDEKYIKTTVKTFEDNVIIKFIDNEVPKESTHYSCIAAICFENWISQNHPQVNLEQCEFRLKKKKNIDLFDDELEDSSDESEIEAE